MELLSGSDEYQQHPYLHHRNVLNPYTSPYTHPDYLGGDMDFGQDDEPISCPDDEESGQKRPMSDDDPADPQQRSLIMANNEEDFDFYDDDDDDYEDFAVSPDSTSSSLYRNKIGCNEEQEQEEEGGGKMSSYPNSRGFNSDRPAEEEEEEEGNGEYNRHFPSSLEENETELLKKKTGTNKSRNNDDYNPKTDGKKKPTGPSSSGIEEKLMNIFGELKSSFNKRFSRFSEFCSLNCFFSLLFVIGVLLVFLDHYGSAYVRMMSMQKFFFFIMGVLTTTVAVVVVCVVVAFTSCYGDGF